MKVSLITGSGTAVVGPGIAVLLAAPPGHPVVGTITYPTLAGQDLTTLLDRLGEHPLGKVPPLAILERGRSGIRLLVRDGVHATVQTLEGSQAIDATGHRTWVEVNLPPEASVTVHLKDSALGPASEEHELPIGVLPAGALVATPSDPSGTKPDDAGPELAGMPAAIGTGGPEPTVEAVSTMAAVTAPDQATTEPDHHLDYEHLFEGTVFRQNLTPPANEPTPVTSAIDDPPAPIGPPLDPPPEEPEHPGADQVHPLNPETSMFIDPSDTASPRARQPSTPPTPPTTAPAAGPGVIDHVPGMGTTPPAPAPPPPPPNSQPAPTLPTPPAPTAPAAGPFTGPGAQGFPVPNDPASGLEPETTARIPSADNPAHGPQIAAVHCPAGHANPSHADVCRTCRSAVTDRTITTVHRPSLGRLRFDDGQVVELHRHLVVGRSPSSDLQVNGAPTDRVTVPAPDNAVSRTHLVVELDGWQVRVTDRDSRNHTFVEIPGRPRFQLRAGEAYPIPAGSTVWLSDEASFVYEA